MVKNEKNNNKQTNKKKQQQQQQQSNVSSYSRTFLENKECSQYPGKSFVKMPQEDSFSSQAADFKSETQLKTGPPDILQKPHPDLELYL